MVIDFVFLFCYTSRERIELRDRFYARDGPQLRKNSRWSRATEAGAQGRAAVWGFGPDNDPKFRLFR